MNTDKNHNWIYAYAYAQGQVWDEWRAEPPPPAWIDGECEAVHGRADKLTSNDTLKFALLTDTHYVINGTWEDTVYSLRKTHELIGFDGIIHLGDLTDGMLSYAKTREFENTVINGMRSLGIPVYIVYGNHDYNYFRGNTDLIYPDAPQFYADCEAQGLRLIFIDSFDPLERLRYGFTDYCIHWLEAALHGMPPEGFCAIVFSHVTPLVRLQAWTNDIRGRMGLIGVLDKYADRILAFINGHNHCDLLFNDLYNGKFPIISINSSKCECFYEHKPDGGITPMRALGDRTQECWDILLTDTKRRRLDFIRFGAGSDRAAENGKARFV